MHPTQLNPVEADLRDLSGVAKVALSSIYLEAQKSPAICRNFHLDDHLSAEAGLLSLSGIIKVATDVTPEQLHPMPLKVTPDKGATGLTP